MQAIVVVDSIPLLANVNYTNKLKEFFVQNKIIGVLWSRFVKGPDTIEGQFKHCIYGHIGGFKTLAAFRREFIGKLDMNLPIVLIDNDENSLIRGGFDHAVDLRKYSDSNRFNTGVVGMDLVINDISRFMGQWTQRPSSSKRVSGSSKQPAAKKVKWNC